VLSIEKSQVVDFTASNTRTILYATLKWRSRSIHN